MKLSTKAVWVSPENLLLYVLSTWVYNALILDKNKHCLYLYYKGYNIFKILIKVVLMYRSMLRLKIIFIGSKIKQA